MTAPVAKRLGWPAILGYGVGDIANNLAFAMGTYFLLNYYSEVAGLPLVAAGALISAVKIYDAFADLAAGRLIDRTCTRWGKFRPFILFGALPLLLLNIAVFSVPAGWSTTEKLIYAYVTYGLFGTAYSLVNIAYGSLASAMTQAPVDRARLGAARTIMAVCTGSVLVMLVGPSLAKLGGEALQARLSLFTAIEAVVGCALFALCCATTREVVPRPAEPPAFAASLKSAGRNLPLLMTCGCALFALLGLTCSGASLVYFARYLSGDPKQFFFVLGLLGIATAGVAFVLVPPLVARIGKKGAMLMGLGLAALGYLALYAACGDGSPTQIFGAFALASTGVRISMSTMWALETDAVEYGEWKTGVRAEGLTYAFFSLSRKCGQALGAGIPALLLACGGYQPAAATQTAAALEAIARSVALLPALALGAAFALMCFYPLTDAAFGAMLRDIRRRTDAAG